MDITLYHSPGACSTASYISLLEAGADFGVEIVNLKTDDHLSAEYSALNPKQKVPYLVCDAKGLSETVAIQYWIAETYPEARLLPADRWDRATAISHMGWFGSGIHPHITRHFKTAKFCGVDNAFPDIREKAKAMLFQQLSIVDEVLADRIWFFDHYTACDSYFFWVFDRALREGFALENFKNCYSHNDRMRERASVQKVLAHKAV
ncbi:glutathione S-transferase family protein [Hoeflea sp. CAU 1731]